jgi:hypothetical protein
MAAVRFKVYIIFSSLVCLQVILHHFNNVALFFVCFLVTLGFELRASCLLIITLPLEPLHQPNAALLYTSKTSLLFLART